LFIVAVRRLTPLRNFEKQAETGKLQNGGMAAAIILMIRPAGEIIGRPFFFP